MHWLMQIWRQLTAEPERPTLVLRTWPDWDQCREPIRYIGDPRDIYLA